jgi:hypothetical protein
MMRRCGRRVMSHGDNYNMFERRWTHLLAMSFTLSKDQTLEIVWINKRDQIASQVRTISKEFEGASAKSPRRLLGYRRVPSGTSSVRLVLRRMQAIAYF